MKVKLLLFLLFCVGMIQAQSEYYSYESLSKKIKELESKHKNCKVKSIGKSSGGKDIWLITLSASEITKPALLITAGINGNHPSGTLMSIKLMEQLLTDSAFSKILEKKTLYFTPSVNPDAMEAYFGKLKFEKSGNATVTDDDKDGEDGEDGFEDLNGDGWISQMRVESVTGNFTEHSEDSRILVKADQSKNQVGKYLLFTEGKDNDKDGAFNEDFSEGVNIDKNFTFDFPAFEKGAGNYAASEPETKALLDFLYLNPQIYSVITFGMHNNLSEAPKFDSKTTSGRIIKGWLEKDVKAAEQVSKIYTQKAGLTDAPKMPMTKGNFAQTAYFHAGRFSFSTPGWWMPKEEMKKDSIAPKVEKPKKGEMNEVLPELEFLRWAEKNEVKNVFLNWTTISHPDFPNQIVEVGGFLPFVMHNPPAQFIEESVTKHKLFLTDLVNAMPKIETTQPLIEKLEGDVYRITIKIANKGLLPTYTEIGDKIRFISRMKTEIKLNANQSMLSGRKYFLRNALQPDESEEYSWLIAGKGKVVILTGCATTGVKEISIDLK